MLEFINWELSPLSLFLSGVMLLLVGLIWSDDNPDQPKGPMGWPLLGHIHMFASKHPAEQCMQLKVEYGRILKLKVGHRKVFVLQDYEIMKEAFVEKSEETSFRMGSNRMAIRLFQGKPAGIVMNHGEELKAVRKFTLSALRDFGVGKQTFEEKILEEAEATLCEVMSKSSASIDSSNLGDLYQKGISNIIISICFGERCDYNDPEFLNVLGSLSVIFKSSGFGQPSNVFPILRFVPFFKDKTEDMIEAVLNVREYVQMCVDRHRGSFDPSNIRDFTDLYLKEECENVNASTKIPAESLLFAIVDLFLAGSETTASAFAWLTFFMANNPEVQQKAREEVMQVVGADRNPSYKDQLEMPYVRAVIEESYRLGTIAPLGLAHYTEDPVTLSGYYIPEKSILLANIYGIHMDETTWEEPHKFKPERFLNLEGQFVKHEHVVAFSLGSRGCLGEHLARMETFLFLTTFLQNVEFRFPEGDTHRPVLSVSGMSRKPEPYHISISSLYK